MTKVITMLGIRISEFGNKATSRVAKIKEERGATAVEYALIVGLIAVVIIAAVTFLGGTIRDIFNKVGSSISKA